MLDAIKVRKALGKRVRELRLKKKWSQEDLAHESGLARSGGSISYTWDSKAINPVLTSPLQRVVTSRTVVPDASSSPSSIGYWQYHWIIPQYIYGYTPEDEYLAESIVTDPDGNDTVHAVEPSYDPSSGNLLYTDVSYSGSSPDNPTRTGSAGTVLKTVTRTRLGAQSPFYTDWNDESIQGPVTSIVMSYPDGHATKTTSTFTPAQSVINYNWNSYNQNGGNSGASAFYYYSVCACINYDLPTSTSTYAYGPTSPGSLIATSNIVYQWQNNAAYLTANLLDLPASIITTDGSNRISETDYGYDESPSPTGARGHATTVGKWLDTANSFLSTKMTFSSQGMPTDRYDANYLSGANPGNYIHTTYDSTGLYPESVSQSVTSNGAAHVDHYLYDFNTGLMLSHVDQNGIGMTDAAHMTVLRYADPLNRLTNVFYPPTTSGTPEVDFAYDAANNIVAKKELQGGGVTLLSSVQYDGLGRTTKTIDTAMAEVDIVYNSMGQMASKTNPYLVASGGRKTFLYDPLGRMTKQTDQDGSAEWLCYDGLPDPTASQPNCHANYSMQIGEWVDFADEAGKNEQRVQDSLGRLVEVSEFPSGAVGVRLETDYAYSPLSNLESVVQKGVLHEVPRQRTFTYDSLSRLITAYNPEIGTICYGTTNGAAPSSSNCTPGYDANGNVLYKTDSRAFTTQYTYDALSRMTQKIVPMLNISGATGSYLASCFQYDISAFGSGATNFIGRLTNEWTQAGSCPAAPIMGTAFTLRSVLAYDSLGKVTNEQQCVLGTCASSTPYMLSYTYDLLENVTSANDGTGAITWMPTYDSAGRLAGVQALTAFTGAQYPTSLFNAGAAPGTPATSADACDTNPYGPVGLQNWTAGGEWPGVAAPTITPALVGHRCYDTRLRITNQTVVGHQ
jgi:YD repeat-containing protein